MGRLQRSSSPFWDQQGMDESEDEYQKAESSDFSRAVKGLFKKVVDPNQPDPSNPVIHGASQPTRATALKNLVADLVTQAPRVGANYELVSSLAKTEIFDGGVVDDRQYQMEQLIQLAATLPENSRIQSELSGKVIKLLWNNLRHPPLSKLGDSYIYRMPDGSNNNVMYPHLGQAGSSYARTVLPQTYQPGVLPEPSVLFDSIFARGDKPKEHPNKISSMLFYWASIIIHDVFHTDERDSTKVKTSSYLDLAPLYGSSQEEQNKIRTFRDGLLEPDTFCEARILGFPPGVAALLVCLNRYHNYVAMQLKIINERGKFTEPADKNDSEGFRKLDNDLFQTARLVTCGLYVNIILTDYVRTILNLNESASTWTLDPRADSANYFDEQGVPCGIGNQVSVEFNLIYRWHSAMSVADATWTEEAYKTIFEGRDASKLDESEFKMGLRKWMRTQGSDPKAWSLDLGKIQRTKRGPFRDEDLQIILTKATDDVACAFGARQVPIVMKLIETMGIKQAREWNVATLNEFRKFFKLKPYTSFSEISSNQDVAHALKSLYRHPDYVELYPGIVAEDAKKTMQAASGLCPGYTISRTILADAVALVRGDRFYTIDYSPANLTAWAHNQIESDPNVAQGHVIYNLFMRALPNWYRGNSIYAMFPFVVPSKNIEILQKLETKHLYNFDKPTFKAVPTPVKTWQGVVNVLKDANTFHVPWGRNTRELIGAKYPYMLSGDDDRSWKQRDDVDRALSCPVNPLKHVREFYEALTTQLVEISSDRLHGDVHQLDACADVANPSHAIFVARMWHIPLKGHGDMFMGVEVDKLYLALAISFAYVFLDLDTAKSFKLRDAAKSACNQLSGFLKVVCKALKCGQFLNTSRYFELGEKGQLLEEYGSRLIRRLFDQDKSVDEVVSIIIPTAAAAVATQAQHFTQMLDLYLSEPYKHHWEDIQRCAASEDPADFEKLKMYALEANRLRPAAYGVLREATKATTIDDDGFPVRAKQGDQIYLDFVSAGQDEKKFPNPKTIDITRDKSLYIHQGTGPHECLGKAIVEVAMAAQLRVFAKLKNLRRAPGPQGILRSNIPVPNPFSSDPVPSPGNITVFMKEDYSDWWPFPTSLKVHHEGFIKSQEDQLLLNTGLPHRDTDLRATRDANRDPNGLAPNEPQAGNTTPEIKVNGESHINGEAHVNGNSHPTDMPQADANAVVHTNGTV